MPLAQSATRKRGGTSDEKSRHGTAWVRRKEGMPAVRPMPACISPCWCRMCRCSPPIDDALLSRCAKTKPEPLDCQLFFCSRDACVRLVVRDSRLARIVLAAMDARHAQHAVQVATHIRSCESSIGARAHATRRIVHRTAHRPAHHACATRIGDCAGAKAMCGNDDGRIAAAVGCCDCVVRDVSRCRSRSARRTRPETAAPRAPPVRWA